MSKAADNLTRRAFIAASGALVVGLQCGPSWADAGFSPAQNKPPLTPDWLDSWLAIEPDGSVTVFYGRIDGGQGLGTSIAQMVAEDNQYACYVRKCLSFFYGNRYIALLFYNIPHISCKSVCKERRVPHNTDSIGPAEAQ